MKQRSVSIFGVTGSIGKSTVDVIMSAADCFDVRVVSAHRDVQGLAAAAIKLGADKAVIADDAKLDDLKDALSGHDVQVYAGREALIDLAGDPVDISMAAIVGMAGLEPLMAAIKNCKTVAIANKEPLVAAGPLVMDAAKRYDTKILPVDSEHNAIFQVFDDKNREQIERIILTASGGPFRLWSAKERAMATPKQAVAHPNWDMGAKISVDSATMMNKALEVIEAHYLFAMVADKIDVVVHPQSVVHSMVEYADGSVLAQMGASDMRTPIAYALSWPDRMQTPGQKLDVCAMSRLEFFEPDCVAFPALGLAYSSLEAGLMSCIALNAANEIAVDAFLREEIGFAEIVDVVNSVLESADHTEPDSIVAVISMDRAFREKAECYIKAKDR